MSACWDRAAAVERLEGDEGLLEELIVVFFEDYPRLMGQLKQGVAEGNFTAIREAAHTLKGSLAYLEALDAAACAFEIETLARLAEPAATAQVVRKLAVKIEVLRQEMTSAGGDRNRAVDIR